MESVRLNSRRRHLLNVSSAGALVVGAVAALGSPAIVYADKPPPPVVSRSGAGGVISSGVQNGAPGIRGGSGGGDQPAAGSGGGSGGAGSPYCRVVDLNTNPEDSKLLDVSCGNGGQDNPQISTAVLAQQARNRLPIPQPRLEVRPYATFRDGARGGITGAPLWLWIGDSTWKTFTQRVSAGPVWVVVVAKPTTTSWNLGDGTSISCSGKGTPLTDAAKALQGSPDCGHVYKATSQRQAGHAFKVTGTVTWSIMWTGSGNTGGILEPLTLSNTIPYAVREARSELVSP